MNFKSKEDFMKRKFPFLSFEWKLSLEIIVILFVKIALNFRVLWN